MRGSRLGRRVERQSRGSMVFFVKFVIVVGIYCRKTENQKRVCIVKIFGVHDPRLRQNRIQLDRYGGFITILKSMGLSGSTYR